LSQRERIEINIFKALIIFVLLEMSKFASANSGGGGGSSFGGFSTAFKKTSN
jgi:preprotein translocase subunit SecG